MFRSLTPQIFRILLMGLLFVPAFSIAQETNKNTPKALPHFSFHLMSEPSQLDPATSQGAFSTYLFSNLFESLYRFHASQGLIPAAGLGCTQKALQIKCKLKPSKWSNGEEVKALHYVLAFKRLIDPDRKSSQAEHLLNVKNAKRILKAEVSPDQLGVSAPNDSTVLIELESPDPEFLFKLTSPALAPVYSLKFPTQAEAHTLVTNGPYKIKQWKKGRLLELVPNTFYPGATELPPVDIYFVDDDSTALNLYESGRLTFLRRLVTDKIENFKSRPDFYQVPMARFDYIGFGKHFKDQPQLRKLLAESLNYQELASLYKALGVPGCPSLSPKLQSEVHCHKFKALGPNALAKHSLEKVTLAYSKMGGDDIQKGMEWAQHQWKRHLGLQVELQPQENAYYVSQLKNNPYDLFRKGVGLDRPTCLAALEIFTPNHPENYLELNDPKYNDLVSKLSTATSKEQSKKLCANAIKVLIDAAYLIPLGEIHFTMLSSPKFKGWSLNEMNQLDLSQLRVSN